jgi:cytidylate kinase
MPVITISSQYGAGGSLVGRELAKRLKIDYLDKEIIHKVALEINVPSAYVEEYEPEHHTKLRSFFSTIFDLDALRAKAHVMEAAEAAESRYNDAEKIPYQFHVDGWIDSEIYKQMIVKIITALGERRGVVIAGRGGQHILASNPRTLHVRLVADFNERVKRVASKRSMSEKDAAEFVSTLDNRSRDYLRFYFDCDPDQPTLYHLVLNTSRISIDNCTDLVEALAKEIKNG